MECNILTDIAYYYNKFNFELNKLARLDTRTLNELIDVNDILLDIMQILKFNNDEYCLPFSIANDLDSNFFKHVEFEFFCLDDTVTLSFKIPFYKKQSLFNVFKKPIVQNSNLYFLDKIGEYAIYNNETRKFMSLKKFTRTCKIILGKTYCEEPGFN